MKESVKNSLHPGELRTPGTKLLQTAKANRGKQHQTNQAPRMNLLLLMRRREWGKDADLAAAAGAEARRKNNHEEAI